MIQIQCIDHLVLRVVDLPRMIGFYRDVLGCTMEREQPELGLYQLRAGCSLVDLVTVDGALGRQGGAAPGPEGRNLDHLCFRVEPFEPEHLRAHLAALGVESKGLASRYGAEGQGLSFFVEDPEGNQVEIKGRSSKPAQTCAGLGLGAITPRIGPLATVSSAGPVEPGHPV